MGLLSTVENKINHKVLETSFTTPDAVQLNALLAEMVASGCTHGFMEVSSHALVQQRVAGIVFTGGVFTNITTITSIITRPLTNTSQRKSSFLTDSHLTHLRSSMWMTDVGLSCCKHEGGEESHGHSQHGGVQSSNHP